MYDHLRYRKERVEPRGPAGGLAERRLMLNDEESVKYREFVLGIIGALESEKRRLQNTISAIDESITLHPEEIVQLEIEKDSTAEDLAKLEQHMTRIVGTA